jgi:hypothetical protein
MVVFPYSKIASNREKLQARAAGSGVDAFLNKGRSAVASIHPRTCL